MKVLVVSDTHRKNAWLRQIMEDEAPFDILIHAGDMEADAQTELVQGNYELRIVSGNCDYGNLYPLYQIVKMEERTALVLHGHTYENHYLPINNMEWLVAQAKNKKCDMIIYGHTHVPDYRVLDDGFIILNPGSLTLPRQSGFEKTYAVLEVNGKEVTVTRKSIEE